MGEAIRQTVLAVDTATEACSAALLVNGEITGRREVAPQRHDALVFEMCRALLREAQIGFEALDALVFGRGPGAFTGVRIAAALVQSIAWVRSLPVVGVSDLQSVAQSAMERRGAQPVLVAMDARMGEVYYGCFECDAQGLACAVGEEGVASPQAVQVPAGFSRVCIGAGSGWKVARAALSTRFDGRLDAVEADILPDAAVMLRLAIPRIRTADILPASGALPVYLRNPLRR